MNIAIIPARKNSVRIKNKNKKLFFKRPIIEYSIFVAKKTKLFKYIYVTTDCNKIADISKKAGAFVLKRSKRLAYNNVGIADVVKDAILKLNSNNIFPKYVCCIFPASPLIEKEKIIQGLKKIKKKKCNFIFSASKSNFDIFKSFSLSNKNYINLLFKKKLFNKQVNRYIFFDAGQFYWAKSKTWLNKKSTFSSKTSIVEIDRDKVQDINHIDDWKFAEFLYRSRKVKSL